MAPAVSEFSYVERWHQNCMEQFAQADLTDIVLAIVYTIAPGEIHEHSVPAPNGAIHFPKGYSEPKEVGFRVEWAKDWIGKKLRENPPRKIRIDLHYGPCCFWSGDPEKFLKEIT